MTTRRKFLLAAPATALLAPQAFANKLGGESTSSGIDDGLNKVIVRHLTRELDDQASAQHLASNLISAGLLWSYPRIAIREADSIIAYSFGNRFKDGKTQADADHFDDRDIFEPGPVNARLADIVHDIRGSRNTPVYAQWEIADILTSQYGMQGVETISPARDAEGKKVYLSTNGVARAVIDRAGSPQALGNACIVGHRDHVKRCIIVSKSLGISSAAAREIEMPMDYDQRSGQAWTRERDVYLLSDVIAQLTIAREQLLKI